MNVSVPSQAVVNEIDHARWNRKAEPFTASALREDESINAYDRAVHIDERTAAIPRVNRSIRLQVRNRFRGIGLARQSAQHAHGHRVLQAFRTADRKHQLPDPRPLLIDKR